MRPEREFARWGESLWHWGHRDGGALNWGDFCDGSAIVKKGCLFANLLPCSDGLETTANSKDSKIQIGSKAAASI